MNILEYIGLKTKQSKNLWSVLKTKIGFQYQNKDSSKVREKKSKMQETYTFSEM